MTEAEKKWEEWDKHNVRDEHKAHKDVYCISFNSREALKSALREAIEERRMVLEDGIDDVDYVAARLMELHILSKFLDTVEPPKI